MKFQKPLFILVFAAAGYIAYACTDSESGEAIRYTLFSPKTAERDNLEPFYFSTEFLNWTGTEENIDASQNKNVDEWVAALDNKYTAAALKPLIYAPAGATAGSIDKKNATLLAMQKSHKAMYDYLLFAKECENANFVEYVNSWDEKPKDDKAKIALQKKLIASATASGAAATNEFLKTRYAYQLVLLNRYSSNWKGTIAAFDAIKNTNTIAYWWAMHHKATALYNLGDTTQADYVLAQVFANDDLKKTRMYEGYTGNNFDKILSYCKNTNEKAAVYTLSGLHNPGENLDGLKQMIALAPEGKAIETLLLREVNKLEDWILTNRMTGYGAQLYPNNNYDYSRGEVDYAKVNAENRVKDTRYAKEVAAWVAAQMNNPKLRTPALWATVNAYLSFVTEDYAAAQALLAKAEQTKGLTPELKDQIAITRIVCNMNIAPDGIPNQAALLADIAWFDKKLQVKNTKKEVISKGYGYGITPAQKMHGQWMLALAERCRTVGNITWATLFEARATSCYTSSGLWTTQNDGWFYNLDTKNKVSEVEKVIAILEKKDKTPLEKLMTDSIHLSINRLYDLAGTKYLRVDNLDKAAEYYNKIPATWWSKEKAGYDIYDDYIKNKSVFVVEQTSKRDKVFANKTEVLETLLAVKKLADAGDAKAMYRMGNAYYNMSFYGNAWAMTHYWWTRNGYESNTFEDPKSENYLRNTRARNWYTKARDAATATNPKFAALCQRMIAQCELGETYAKKGEKNGYLYLDDDEVKMSNMLAVKVLKKDYKSFSKELLGNCSGWSDFLK